MSKERRPQQMEDFDAAIQVQIDKAGHFIISEQSIKAIAEAVVKKLAEANK